MMIYDFTYRNGIKGFSGFRKQLSKMSIHMLSLINKKLDLFGISYCAIYLV